ncbi:hypothetical protein EG68_11663 [Paragonimus skrjabini miyazakii]|uniref:Uncharacterized protein n=1 Tax=Paragonimus skrjabini miyazakii TaxID=59628 RepID=A0A8S9YDM9_9TREM|nr:hypothetical protein EG68_11663 [Paragonimus skrjabini miyazakii]
MSILDLLLFSPKCKSAVIKGIEFLSEQIQKMDPEDTCKLKWKFQLHSTDDFLSITETPFVLNTIRSKQSLCSNHVEKHEINTHTVHFSFLHQLIAIALSEIEFRDLVDPYPFALSAVLDRTRSYLR